MKFVIFLWLLHRLYVALFVMEGVVSIHPDIFQGANRIISILPSPGARLPPRSAELSSISLDGRLSTLTWHLHYR